MFSKTRQIAAAVVMAGVLALGGAISAQVQNQDGLVNVAIGDVTILEDVRIALAAQVAANICGVTVQGINVLATTVDQTGTTSTVCNAKGGRGPVTISQN